jgi:hypothetical protein
MKVAGRKADGFLGSVPFVRGKDESPKRTGTLVSFCRANCWQQLLAAIAGSNCRQQFTEQAFFPNCRLKLSPNFQIVT